MLLFFLALATLGSIVLAPIIAGCVVFFEPASRDSRFAAWLGLSIGFGTASTVPLFSSFVAVAGQTWGYNVAPLVGLLLGAQIMRVHLRRLRGVDMHLRPTAYACIAFALLVAAALAPLITGAPLPAGGEFGAESPGPGDVGAYAWIVIPVILAMGIEAWMMLRPSRIRHLMSR